jgi:hypothetical protein
LLALRRVLEFLDPNADKLSVVPNSGARKKLDAPVEALNLRVLTQTESDLTSQGATQKQHALRHTPVYDHMAPISRIARAELPDTPELHPLRMPKGRLSIERLYAAAIGMAKAAAEEVIVTKEDVRELASTVAEQVKSCTSCKNRRATSPCRPDHRVRTTDSKRSNRSTKEGRHLLQSMVLGIQLASAKGQSVCSARIGPRLQPATPC